MSAADVTSYKVDAGTKVVLERNEISLQDALNDIEKENPILKPGDVVGIRQVSGWTDIGSVVTIRGQVKFPGVLGIERGERLSSIISRAGGFTSEAYPYAAVLERVDVARLNAETRDDLARKLRSSTLSSNAGSAAELMQFREIQREVLSDLESQPVSGRLAISITAKVDEWANSPADIIVQPGDQITIPKNKQFVMVNGQVFNPTAIAYEKSRPASWYLRAAGGFTRMADQKNAYIIRANGLVVASKSGFFGESVLNARMRPGDTLVIPQKITVGSPGWQHFAVAAQTISALAIAGAAVAGF
jgi:protein involved in polysaccharide export with SLBB domain